MGEMLMLRCLYHTLLLLLLLWLTDRYVNVGIGNAIVTDLLLLILLS